MLWAYSERVSLYKQQIISTEKEKGMFHIRTSVIGTGHHPPPPVITDIQTWPLNFPLSFQFSKIFCVVVISPLHTVFYTMRLDYLHIGRVQAIKLFIKMQFFSLLDPNISTILFSFLKYLHSMFFFLDEQINCFIAFIFISCIFY